MFKTTRKPLFVCQECGKKFYTVEAAERASFGDSGCPKCGGSDIDQYVEPKQFVTPTPESRAFEAMFE